jgi:hypothetical protein
MKFLPIFEQNKMAPMVPRVTSRRTTDLRIPAPEIPQRAQVSRASSRRRGVIVVKCQAVHIAVTDFRKASYIAKLKRTRPKIGYKWFLDEVFLKINGVQHYLWRAVDQQGTVIDNLVQPKRDHFAAIRLFFRKQLKIPKADRAKTIQVGDDLYGERSAGKATLAVVRVVGVGDCRG